MPGWLGAPTLAKMGVDAAGRLWRRLKNKKNKQGRKEDLHTFYTDSFDTISYSNSDPDTLECLGTIEDWVDATPDTYDFFGAWHYPSEPSSIASFDGEADLVRSVSVRALAKPAKRGGIKGVFKNVKKAAFKQRDNSG